MGESMDDPLHREGTAKPQICNQTFRACTRGCVSLPSEPFWPHSCLLSFFSKVPLAKSIYGLIGPNGGLGFAIGKLPAFGIQRQPGGGDDCRGCPCFGQEWWIPP